MLKHLNGRGPNLYPALLRTSEFNEATRGDHDSLAPSYDGQRLAFGMAQPLISLRVGANSEVNHEFLVRDNGPVMEADPSTQKLHHLPKYIDWRYFRDFPFGMTLTYGDGGHTIEIPSEMIEQPGHWETSVLPEQFRCVDVVDECVCFSPRGSPYVALSYVWGPVRSSDLQATMANIQSLGHTHALSQIELPQTIRDAMTVCKELNLRYLWVDRLCNVQDAPDLPELIDSMGLIYGNAIFTIAATAGEDAHYGLPGVGKPRSWSQGTWNVLGLEIVTSAPYLDQIIVKNKWNTRSWTYQEQVMSKNLLYFTDYGMYYAFSEANVIMSETRIGFDWGRGISNTLKSRQSYHFALPEYTRRHLSYPSDYLRAFSGLLFSQYGSQTMWGLPCADFDRALLWRPRVAAADSARHDTTNFPTWSWTSAGKVRQKQEIEVISVALWFCISDHEDDEIVVLVPKLQGCSFTFEDGAGAAGRARLIAALALREGCFLSSVPGDLNMQTDQMHLGRLLAEKWPQYILFWREMFTSSRYDVHSEQILSRSQRKAATAQPGRVIVHTQIVPCSSLSLDTSLQHLVAREHDSFNLAIIRDHSGFPVGHISLPATFLDELDLPDSNQRCHFISLAATHEDCDGPVTVRRWPEVADPDELTEMLSQLIACPCTRTATDGESRDDCISRDHDSIDKPIHLDLCPLYTGANGKGSAVTDLFQSRGDAYAPGRPSKSHQRRMIEDTFGKKMFDQLGYRDRNGKNILKFHESYAYEVPALKVMLIRRSATEPHVATRVNIGQIYMKKWLQARPRFETVVLA
jgi:hypothetical protein